MTTLLENPRFKDPTAPAADAGLTQKTASIQSAAFSEGGLLQLRNPKSEGETHVGGISSSRTFSPCPTTISLRYCSIPELLITVPIEIFIPSVAASSAKKKRSIDDHQGSSTMQKVLAWLGIAEDDTPCQKHLVCQLMKHPQKYAPLSTFIYLILKYDPIE